MPELSKRRRKKLQAKIDAQYGYQIYRDRDVEIQHGGPCGRGLFAVRQFLPGELVVEVGGQLLRTKDYASSLYVMELNKKWYLEPDIPAAFSNHSCSPNCELVQVTKYTMRIVAICNIEPGTEICYDYQWPADDWVPKCLCGARNCRGWVVAANKVKRMRKIAKRLARKKPR